MVAGAVMVRLIAVVCVRLPDVPVTVTGDVPGVALLVAANVTTLVLVVGFVANVAVTPAGKPDAVKATELLKPPNGLTVMVLGAVAPCGTLTVAGAAERVKS